MKKSGRARACPICLLSLLCAFMFFAVSAYAQDTTTLMPPASPSEVYVSGIEENRATVSWSPVATATQYTVWVNGQRWAGSSYPGAEITGLQPYTEYSVYVTAANDVGESGPSSLVTFKTLPPVPGVPATPVVSDVTDTTAVVKWQPLPAWQHIQKYRIYVDGKAVADVNPVEGIQQAQLTNLDPGGHTVAVSGINENREGELSPTVSFTIQAVPAPAGLVMANRSADSIWITWDPITGADRYKIYVDGNLVGETNETRYLIQNLETDKEYLVGVSAMLPDGNESARATLAVKTLPLSEPLSLAVLMSTGYKYIPDAMPGIIALFIVGGAFALARMGKYSLSRRLKI